MERPLRWIGIALVGLVLGGIGAAIGGGVGTSDPAAAEQKPSTVSTEELTSNDDMAERLRPQSAKRRAGQIDEDSDGYPVDEDVDDFDASVGDEASLADLADGRFDLICDYDLGDFGESGDPAAGYKFIGGGTIENAGPVDIRVEVTYKWRLLGQGSLVEKRRYKLPAGRQKDIDISVPVPQGHINAHKSADSNCTTDGKIVDVLS